MPAIVRERGWELQLHVETNALEPRLPARSQAAELHFGHGEPARAAGHSLPCRERRVLRRSSSIPRPKVGVEGAGGEAIPGGGEDELEPTLPLRHVHLPAVGAGVVGVPEVPRLEVEVVRSMERRGCYPREV